MANRISIPNPDLRKYQYTEVTVDATAGSSVSLTVKNNNGFTTDDMVIIRRKGNEQSEIAKVTGTSGSTTITIDTLDFALTEGAEIRKIPYDQVGLFYSSSEDGTYSQVGSYVDIDYDNQVTYITHDAGDSSTWYKAKFKNSTSGVTTDYSDTFQSTDAGFYCTISEILEEAGMSDNRYLEMDYVHRTRKRAQQEVDGKLFGVYDLPFDSVPDTVKEVTRLLAAGWVLYKEYGAEADGTSKDGMQKIKEARSWLKQIADGSIILTDSDGEAITRAGSSYSKFSGYPDEADITDEKVHFKISDEF